MPDANRQYRYAELFAGCGGLSLGLHAAGLRRVFANELSPMAAATYVYNLYETPPEGNDEGFVRICERKRRKHNPSKWLDDPREYLRAKLSPDFRKRLRCMQGAMFVGGVEQFLRGLRDAKNRGTLDSEALDLDLLAGGPPCQSFSCAGRREEDNPRNQLPYRLMECAKILQPKIVVLENVSGILRPFTNGNGDLSHAWLDIARRFYAVGYVPICTHSSARHYGVPQSRPRFVMVSVRKDIVDQCMAREAISSQWAPVLKQLRSARHYLGGPSGSSRTRQTDRYRWIDASARPDLWPDALLARTKSVPGSACAIDDLPRQKGRSRRAKQSDYPRQLSLALPVPGKPKRRALARKMPANHEFREHCPRVRARFRVLRVLAKRGATPWESKRLSRLPPDLKEYLMGKKLYFFQEDRNRCPTNMKELENLLEALSSKKQSQKALNQAKPAPAQLTIPDDGVHYAEDRTLTVREMARFQSFPDDFEFVGKVTTGGDMRAYEVPQYTQVGNAVPPLLGRAIGLGVVSLLQELEGAK